jgi:pimeloyl-ACP methyl ester carboxylesterase
MPSPTIVLVHGAFADAASWAPVTRILLDRGHTVIAPPLYMRSLAADAASLRALVEHIDGPVLLAGHSYGGAVITIAGEAANVVGLVYVSGYALDTGETISKLQGGFPDSELIANLVFTPFPIPGQEDGSDVSVKIDAFPHIFAAGLDPRVSEVLAVSQRPLAASVFAEEASAAAWKTKPAWGIVSADDHTINPDVERFGYTRAGIADVTELKAPHLVMQTNPQDVVDVIERAVAGSGGAEG